MPATAPSASTTFPPPPPPLPPPPIRDASTTTVRRVQVTRRDGTVGVETVPTDVNVGNNALLIKRALLRRGVDCVNVTLLHDDAPAAAAAPAPAPAPASAPAAPAPSISGSASAGATAGAGAGGGGGGGADGIGAVKTFRPGKRVLAGPSGSLGGSS
jgi:hypothetical protein